VVEELVDDDFDLSPSLIDAFKSSSCVLSPASDRQTSNRKIESFKTCFEEKIILNYQRHHNH
jgi:hypothetical protein